MRRPDGFADYNALIAEVTVVDYESKTFLLMRNIDREMAKVINNLPCHLQTVRSLIELMRN